MQWRSSRRPPTPGSRGPRGLAAELARARRRWSAGRREGSRRQGSPRGSCCHRYRDRLSNVRAPWLRWQRALADEHLVGASPTSRARAARGSRDLGHSCDRSENGQRRQRRRSDCPSGERGRRRRPRRARGSLHVVRRRARRHRREGRQSHPDAHARSAPGRRRSARHAPPGSGPSGRRATAPIAPAFSPRTAGRRPYLGPLMALFHHLVDTSLTGSSTSRTASSAPPPSRRFPCRGCWRDSRARGRATSRAPRGRARASSSPAAAASVTCSPRTARGRQLQGSDVDQVVGVGRSPRERPSPLPDAVALPAAWRPHGTGPPGSTTMWRFPCRAVRTSDHSPVGHDSAPIPFQGDHDGVRAPTSAP